MDISNYWQFVKINSTNKRQVEMIAAAKTYFQNKFTETSEVSNAKIVRQLWQQVGSGGEKGSQNPNLAEICLRCSISHQIDRVCSDLVNRFGLSHGFNCEDLLPFVLPDEILWSYPRKQLKSSYKSLATSLLETFNPDKGSLNTWVKRYVKQHPELKKVLLEHGVFLISDWALLNDVSTQNLQQILSGTYNSTNLEIQQSIEALISYHAVYREDRLQQRVKGITLPCQPPTPEQLNRICDDIKNRTSRTVAHELLFTQLQDIATKIRRYKNLAQGGKVSEVSLDKPGIQPILERSQATHEDEEQGKFIQLYQDKFIESLDIAFSQVIDEFTTKIERKPTAIKNKKSLLTALQLFHCQGTAMSQIALQIGFKKQYEVTRFLKLNEFRADIRQRLLINLRDRIIEIAPYFTNFQQLKGLDKQIELILDERILSVIKEAESEAKSPIRNQAFRSLFSRQLCNFLKTRNKAEG